MNALPFLQEDILLITNDYPPQKGGVAWYYQNLVEKRDEGKGEHEGTSGDIHVLKLGGWTKTPLWPLMFFPLLLATVTHKISVWWVGQVLPIGIVVWLSSLMWGKSYIVSTHGMDVLVPLKSRRKIWLIKKILERAALITANSEWTKRQIVKNYELGIKDNGLSEKIVVIYPEPKPKRAVSQDELKTLRLKLGIPDDANVLLSVGRLVRRKGIERVFKALPKVWSKISNVYYVIVGEGEEKESLQRICQNNLIPVLHGREYGGSESKVVFAGDVTEGDLAIYYTMADAFILLPREEGGDAEGFGIVYGEADQFGLPVVGCVSGGTEEALQRCRRATRVRNPDNSHEVAEAICRIFQ